MTNREARQAELYGRERKAARLALCMVRNDREMFNVKYVREAVRDPEVQQIMQEACGYGHVSNETWERVVELIKEIPE